MRYVLVTMYLVSPGFLRQTRRQCVLAVFYEFGQVVPHLCQLEDLAVQDLQQCFEALAEALLLYLARLQALLYIS